MWYPAYWHASSKISLKACKGSSLYTPRRSGSPVIERHFDGRTRTNAWTHPTDHLTTECLGSNGENTSPRDLIRWGVQNLVEECICSFDDQGVRGHTATHLARVLDTS